MEELLLKLDLSKDIVQKVEIFVANNTTWDKKQKIEFVELVKLVKNGK